VFSNRIFSASIWLMIVSTSFLTSTRREQPRTVVKTKIGQDLLINNLLSSNGTVRLTPRKLNRLNSALSALPLVQQVGRGSLMSATVVSGCAVVPLGGTPVHVAQLLVVTLQRYPRISLETKMNILALFTSKQKR
jgi:hypothetical protein